MKRLSIALCILWLISGGILSFAEPPEADILLRRAIAYHDPDDLWATGTFEFGLAETRPDGSVRKTALRIDNGSDAFEWTTVRKGRRVEVSFRGDRVEATLDGSSRFTEQEAHDFRLSAERAQSMRNYYTYLYGLPMKLNDPGTRIDPEVTTETFDDRQAHRLKVTYDPKVGQDTWYFYFDPSTYALIGYRFYHDETKNDGEYILIDGQAEVGGIRMPRTRKWYTHAEDKYLGTDSIE